MSLRNLNQSKSRGRICGTPRSGVQAQLVPSTGVDGAGFLYSSLSLPADNGKEVCGYLTSWPSAGTLFADEDSGFTFSGAPDGTYTATFQVSVFGVDVGTPKTLTLTVGGSGTTISCSTGNAAAAGLTANISQALRIAASVGGAAAAGLTAKISQSLVIGCTAGNAAAAGRTATVTYTVGAGGGTIEVAAARTVNFVAEGLRSVDFEGGLTYVAFVSNPTRVDYEAHKTRVDFVSYSNTVEF